MDYPARAPASPAGVSFSDLHGGKEESSRANEGWWLLHGLGGGHQQIQPTNDSFDPVLPGISSPNSIVIRSFLARSV